MGCASSKRAEVVFASPQDVSKASTAKDVAKANAAEKAMEEAAAGAKGAAPSAGSVRASYIFSLDKPLGSGAYAEVRKAKTRREQKAGGKQKVVAIKSIDKSKPEQSAADIKREIEIMSQCEHPNIVQLIETFDEPTHTHLVLECVSGGDLLTHLNRQSEPHLPEREAARITSMLANALAYLHARAFVHRDVKPENVLLCSASPKSSIKLADFGAARVVSERMMTATGTPAFMAPEMLSNKGYSSPVVDVWSAGVLLFLILGGAYPFERSAAWAWDDENMVALLSKIVNGSVSFAAPAWDKVSPAAQKLASLMLEKDPAKRLSAKAAAEMAKAWVRSFRAARAAESTEGGGGGGIDGGIRIDGGGGGDDGGGIGGGTGGDGGIDGNA